MKDFKSFGEFYPYYLKEHSDLVCRRLHFVGSCLVLVLLALTIMTSNLWYLLMVPFAGYGFAWVGHFFFEKNKPATFQYPVYSFIGDWRMFIQMINGKIKF
ncbi:DUF962 domain-containing protein [Alteromonadaceae bacterium M269]|nr:DUF962 domain-containing protein [Alteromonadaceae bacterium M269]